VLDGDHLASLAKEVSDLFPNARLVPVDDPTPDVLERSMAALPLRLDPGPEEPAAPGGMSALRAGLCLAWAAALVALVAVGFGGWSLLTLSERRVRFVSAVTHELRTPLTTLRLYLDMLLGGMVRDEKTKQEYLETMQAETDRLTRLVGNVLDFSRLESRKPKLTRAPSGVSELVKGAAEVWGKRCGCAGKELLVEDNSGEGCTVETDADLLQQVLANLLDNACKYSREAADRRVWLRARREGDRVVFEVEDRGPGIPACERAAIFRPFRRGKAADATTGGVGLGLALARWWSELLGGRLSLHSPAEGGACFRVALPACGPKP
jgi:signal transduction histidine kinase